MNFRVILILSWLAFIASFVFGIGSAFSASATYQYDKLNRITRVDYNNSAYTSFEYDPAGNLTKTISFSPLIASGDINNDGNVSLDDAILGLQILTGVATQVQIFKDADVNGDQKIGFEEVDYILKNNNP